MNMVKCVYALMAMLFFLGEASPAARAETELPLVRYLKIRVDQSFSVRGPDNTDDTALVFLQKSDGTFNPYVSNQGTYSLPNTQHMWNPAGTPTEVIGKNVLGTGTGAPDACGNWLQTTQRSMGVWYALVHSEGPCDYATITTTESMSMFSSTDEGSTWTPVGTGTVWSSGEAMEEGYIVGEGDAGMIPGPDGYEYGYGGYYGGAGTFWVTGHSRARTGQFAPGNWTKISPAHTWSTTGIGSNDVARDLGFVGKYPAKIPGVFPAVLSAADHVVYYGPYANTAANTTPYTINGITLSFSRDMVHFAVLHDPLVPFDAQDFNGRTSETMTDMYVYPGLLNDKNASRTLDKNHFWLTYVYCGPGEDLDHRHAMMSTVRMSIEKTPQDPQVGLSLVKYKSSGTATTATSRTSTAPMNDATYTTVTTEAYVMTDQPINAAPVTKIEECYRTTNGVDDYLLDQDGLCTSAGYTRLRTTGYLFSNNTDSRVTPINTKPIYVCTLASGAHTTGTDSTCNGDVTSGGTLLGYGLAD